MDAGLKNLLETLKADSHEEGNLTAFTAEAVCLAMRNKFILVCPSDRPGKNIRLTLAGVQAIKKECTNGHLSEN